jgi:hypothetical protein
MRHPHDRDEPLSCFLSFIAGPVCFMASFYFMFWFGLMTGIERITIYFGTVPKQPTDYYIISSFFVSGGLSFLVAKYLFRFLSTPGKSRVPNRPPERY